jgi:hypothetical protein
MQKLGLPKVGGGEFSKENPIIPFGTRESIKDTKVKKS